MVNGLIARRAGSGYIVTKKPIEGQSGGDVRRERAHPTKISDKILRKIRIRAPVQSGSPGEGVGHLGKQAREPRRTREMAVWRFAAYSRICARINP